MSGDSGGKLAGGGAELWSEQWRHRGTDRAIETGEIIMVHRVKPAQVEEDRLAGQLDTRTDPLQASYRLVEHHGGAHRVGLEDHRLPAEREYFTQRQAGG